MGHKQDGREDLIWVLGYLALYVLLDWLSWIQPYNGLDITPWNPPPGLTLALLLRRGLKFAPLPYLAAILSDGVTRHFSGPLGPTLLADMVEASGYVVAAWSLKKLWPINPNLTSLTDLNRLLAVTLGASLLTASGFIGVYDLAGAISPGDVGLCWLRFWIGDMIGVAIFAPLFLTFGSRQPAALKGRASLSVSIAQGVCVLLALWSVFGGDLAQHPQLYYPLFLPLVWIGAWHGLQGVTVALFATQIGMIVAIEEAHLNTETVTEVQFFLLALTLTCLLLGGFVTDRRRSRHQLNDSELRLKAVVDIASDGVLTLDEAKRVESVNLAFEWLCGRKGAELIGQPVQDLFPDLARCLRQWGGRARLERPDGNGMMVEVVMGEATLSDRKITVASVRSVLP